MFRWRDLWLTLVLFLSNTKQGHLAFTMGLEDYTYQQCALNVRYLRNRLAQQKCPPTLEINAVKMLLLGEVKLDVEEKPVSVSHETLTQHSSIPIQTWPPH